jgi:hypothetical protein
VLSSFSHFAAAQEQTIALGEIDLTSIREYQGVNEEFLAGVSDKMKELLKSKEIAVLIITTNGTCYCRTISSTRCVLEEQSGTNPIDYSLLREGLENQVFQKWLEIKRIKINRKFYSNEIGKLLRDIHELNVYQEDKANLLAAVGGIIIELPPQQRLQLQEEPHIGAQVRASMTNFRLYELGKSENIYSGSFKTGKDEVSSDVVNLFSEFGDESVQKVGFTSVSPGLGILSRETAPGFRVYIGPAIDPNSSSGKIWNEDFLRIIKNKTVDGLLKDKDVGFYYGFDGSKTVTKIDKIAYMAELRESLGFNL